MVTLLNVIFVKRCYVIVMPTHYGPERLAAGKVVLGLIVGSAMILVGKEHDGKSILFA
jgi:hypothetical protein